MQFHLNGFRVGDPEVLDPAEASRLCARSDALPEEVDVLIVGCGPAGLTLAAQLAAFPDIKTRIIEQKPGPLQLGQAAPARSIRRPHRPASALYATSSANPRSRRCGATRRPGQTSMR